MASILSWPDWVKVGPYLPTDVILPLSQESLVAACYKCQYMYVEAFEMANILQTTFLNASSWIKMVEFDN